MNKTENICILLHFVCKFEYYDNPQRRRSGLECGLQAFRWDMQVREASSMEGRGVGRAYKSDKQIKKKVILVFENTFLSLDFFGFQNKIPAGFVPHFCKWGHVPSWPTLAQAIRSTNYCDCIRNTSPFRFSLSAVCFRISLHHVFTRNASRFFIACKY